MGTSGTSELASDPIDQIGTLVHYYLDGWRYGYLQEVKGTKATIRPIAPRGAAVPRLVRLPLADLRKA